ncbi:MAG: hypothetical protein CBC25_02075 [Pelagibacteraceae bacterium TMED65]|nr:MAG: hypothetical protein CBC25_02075 [Pelagibacteraceae bacterium TMED65]
MHIFKKYYFDATHFMPNFEKNHDYRKMHGHSYEVTIKLLGSVNKKTNWVIDLEELDILVKPVISLLDHSILNDVDGLKYPTSENIAKWLWFRLKKKISNLDSVEIYRPRIGGCIFNGK